MARRPDRRPRCARLAAPSARRPPRFPPVLRPSQPPVGSARSRMPPPPSPRAAPPSLPRRGCRARRRPRPARRSRPAARSSDAGPAQSACGRDGQTPGSGRRDKRTRSGEAARRTAPRAASADRCTGGGLRGGVAAPPLRGELARDPHPRGTHPPRGAHGGGGPDTRRLGRGSGGPQGAEARARATAESRTRGAGSLSVFCANRVFRAGKGLGETSGSPRGPGGRWQRQARGEADGPGSNRIRPNPSRPQRRPRSAGPAGMRPGGRGRPSRHCGHLAALLAASWQPGSGL